MQDRLSVCVVLAMLGPLSGCQSTGQADPAKAAGSPAKVARFTLASSAAPQPAIEITPGRLHLEVEMTRSNKEACTAELTLAAEPGAERSVFAYELGHGLAPATMRVEPHRPRGASSSSSWSGSLSYCGECVALFILTAPIWYPFYAHSKQREAKSRQAAAKYCFVWVEDAQSGEVVAGRLPWEPRNASGGNTPPASPSFEKEDLVNCVVAGERRWAYRSQCS